MFGRRSQLRDCVSLFEGGSWEGADWDWCSYAMYHGAENVTMWELSANTVAGEGDSASSRTVRQLTRSSPGDMAVTTFIQGILTFVIASAMVHVDMRKGFGAFVAALAREEEGADALLQSTPFPTPGPTRDLLSSSSKLGRRAQRRSAGVSGDSSTKRASQLVPPARLRVH